MQSGVAERIFSPSRQRWFVAGLGLLLIAFSVQYGFKARGSGAHATRSAILRWRVPLQHLADENIYQRYAYPNPPIMALILQPLVGLPPLAYSMCWFYLKLGMTVLAIYWAFRLVEDPRWPFPAWAKALTILLSLRPILGDLSHGNVNLFILFLVMAGLYAFQRGRDVTAGLALALAIACKLTPALFVPYFLWKRAWKTSLSCLAGLVLFFVIIPGGALGSKHNWELLTSWTQQMITPFLLQNTVTSEHPNQSLPGLLFRLGTHNPSFLDTQGQPLRYDNLASLDPRTAGWILKGCMALFAALSVWVCRMPVRGAADKETRRQRDKEKGSAASSVSLPPTLPRWRLAAEFSLVLLGMLLFSERTWKHHCVTLLLPFAVLTYYLAVCRPGPLLRAYLIGSLAAVLLLMTSTSTNGIWEVIDEAAKRAQVYGAYVWAYLVLVAALVVILRRREAIPREPGTVEDLSHYNSAGFSRGGMPFDIGERSEAPAHGILCSRTR
jgi:alpha-1,2-mannosyltransferase